MQKLRNSTFLSNMTKQATQIFNQSHAELIEVTFSFSEFVSA